MIGLRPYSTALRDRLTARNVLSVALAAERANGDAVSVLDIGCGNGWFEFLANQHGNMRLTGVDIDDASIARARVNAPHSRFEKASALEVPFEKASFDGAVMFEVIEHVPKGTEARALAEVRRVLKVGGWFVLSTPQSHLASTILDPAWYFGHRHYSKSSITALLVNNGFRVERIDTRGGPWEIYGTIALYGCKWILRSEAPGKERIEEGREREFLSGRPGFTNLFVQATAV